MRIDASGFGSLYKRDVQHSKVGADVRPLKENAEDVSLKVETSELYELQKKADRLENLNIQKIKRLQQEITDGTYEVKGMDIVSKLKAGRG
ncbi:hypothetical protein IMZ31_20970 (plasmid) [Pontibacillus sp. ALD_SL1]|uniref:flagellar biosynthesis anti-sigma factor FlgM n=1 Tax=Pontibacillus sp. ALD_SL1 TaxID=2777185 RepID=UPI001A97789D|nr:flagellar biosynthesis anti-sigma factor FlgM [Pontibacillus sp. ALD_SL1]QST03022.1 hypothetical protein IMZ31_20970 [Pontibacillus sp. ALD_SL1]